MAGFPSSSALAVALAVEPPLDAGDSSQLLPWSCQPCRYSWPVFRNPQNQKTSPPVPTSPNTWQERVRKSTGLTNSLALPPSCDSLCVQSRHESSKGAVRVTRSVQVQLSGSKRCKNISLHELPCNCVLVASTAVPQHPRIRRKLLMRPTSTLFSHRKYARLAQCPHSKLLSGFHALQTFFQRFASVLL